MNMKFFGIITFAFALIFGQSVFAHDSQGCGKGLQEMVKSLNLNADQQEKIKTIKEQLKADMKPNWEQMKSLRDQINQQVQADDMDSSKLNDLINTKVQMIANMIKAKSTARHQIYAILNAQQKTQFQQMQKQHEDKIAAKYAKCHDDD